MSDSVRPLMFYIDPAWRREQMNHAPLLYPFWGNTFSTSLPLMRDVFDRYPCDTRYYKIVSDIAGADAVLLPYRYQVVIEKYPELWNIVRATAYRHQKTVVVDATGDTDVTFSDDRLIVLKWGGYRFKQHPNEVVIPPYSDDLLETCCGGVLQPRAKGPVPIIGFAGWTEMSRALLWKTQIKQIPHRLRSVWDVRYGALDKGVLWRQRVLARLEETQDVRLNVLKRRGYSGNIKTAESDLRQLRSEFVLNALESDLCLDVRGDANASTRLFEVLSLGRVPLIIDTERNFPFSDELDYEEFSIIVDFRELSSLPQLARRAYDSISEDRWLVMQNRARDTYVNWFRPDAMARPLMHRIHQRVRQIGNVA